MAYNNYYPATYQPYYPAAYPQSFSVGTQPTAPSAQTQPQQTTNRWDWVQGENGAKAYLVAPNTTVLLLDSENQRFYLKSADGSGMPLPLRTFEFSEVAQEVPSAAFSKAEITVGEYATKSDIDALTRRIDELAAKRPTSKKKGDEDDE